MSRTVAFEPTARYELNEAAAWYEGKLQGLGDRFRAEEESLIEKIAANPLQFPAVKGAFRRATLQTFPYALIFDCHGDEIIRVLACFHGKRNPVRWHART